MQKKILSTTKEMVRQNVFANLSDSEVLKLHNIIMLAEETNSLKLAASLLHYWYKADFFYTGSSVGLIYPCNALLQSIGMQEITIYQEVFSEN